MQLDRAACDREAEPDATAGAIAVRIYPVERVEQKRERLFGNALEVILSVENRIEVVGRAVDGREAVVLARELDPDVVLVDISMPGVDGFAAIEAMRVDDDDRRVVVLSGSNDPADLEKARSVGACGYLTKDRIADALVSEILSAAAR